MTGDKKKQEPPLALDLDFLEALERFTRTDPKEVAESVERSKQKKPPGSEVPGGSVRVKKKVKPPPDRDR